MRVVERHFHVACTLQGRPTDFAAWLDANSSVASYVESRKEFGVKGVVSTGHLLQCQKWMLENYPYPPTGADGDDEDETQVVTGREFVAFARARLLQLTPRSVCSKVPEDLRKEAACTGTKPELLHASDSVQPREQLPSGAVALGKFVEDSGGQS